MAKQRRRSPRQRFAARARAAVSRFRGRRRHSKSFTLPLVSLAALFYLIDLMIFQDRGEGQTASLSPWTHLMATDQTWPDRLRGFAMALSRSMRANVWTAGFLVVGVGLYRKYVPTFGLRVGPVRVTSG